MILEKVRKVCNMFVGVKDAEVFAAMNEATSIASTYFNYGDCNMDDVAEDILNRNWKAAYQNVLWLWWANGGPQNKGTSEISWAANDLVRCLGVIAKACGFYDPQAHLVAPWCR